MPPVVIAAAVSMAAAGAAAATWIAASTALIITIGASVAGALLTKPPSFGDYTSQQERKQVLRSSTAPQAHIYGRTVTSGLLFFAEEEKGSSTKEWVHLAIALCGHPIDGVEEIWLGDEPIRNYGSNATYEIHSDRQTADPFMLAKCASWKDDMIGKGITWARISLKFDADKFPAGIPNIKFLVRGKRVLDPRNNTVAWTDNAALCIRDYYASYLKVDEADINTQQFIQAANICDQTVTNNGVTRKRYTINGTFDASEASSAVLDDLHLACAGEPTFMAGQHGIFVGAYYGPATMNLVNSQIVSDVQIIPEASFGDKLNIVTGTFLDPNAQFAETEFPQVRVDQYITEDGAEFVDDVKYRFVANVYQAQQLAQIKINRTRIGRSLKFTMNMSGYSYRPGYYVKFTLDELGISNQEFRITDWSINATKGVDITLRQETPAVWLDIIGQPIERPDITDFPSQGIAAPLNLAFTVLNIGDAVQGRLTWKNGTVDVNYNIVIIRQSGKIVQSIQVPGETVDITGLPRGSYEMAVVSVNHFGQHSPEAMIVAEIHAPNTPTSVLMDNGYFEYTLKPQSSDLATVSVQYDFWTSGTTKLANTSDATVTGNATRKGIGKTWTEASDKNDRIYYWYIRAINAFGTSPFIEFAAHFEMEPGKAIDFIDTNIKESETYQELDKGITDNNNAISNANQVINTVKNSVTNIQNDVSLINVDISDMQNDIAQAQLAITHNTESIAKNIDDIVINKDAISKNAADILANTGKINKEITDRANAVSAEATTRASQIAQTAKTAADNLLNEKLAREAAINQTNTVVQNNYDSLATQIAQVSAGTGQQFDSARIYYFDKNPEGWSLDDAGNTPMLVTEDGWLKAPTGQAKFDARSSNDLNVNGSAYKFLKLRIRKVGTPNWVGQLFWIGSTEQGWTDARKYNIPEPSYDANGVSTLDLNDLPWAASNMLRRIRLNLSSNQTDTSYYLIDFVAIGRPTPGASTAALEEERTARVNADASEAAARQTLAAQVRGGYDGTDPSQLTSGLIYSERQVRISAEQAISQSVTALRTDYNNNKATVQQSLDTLTNKTTSNANAITNLTSTVDKKADATALNALTTRVSTVEGTVTSQGNSITSLTSSLNTLKNQTSNPWLDGSFESYTNGQNLSGSDGKCVVTTDQHYVGSKALKVTRSPNENGNSDKTLAVRSTIRENAFYKFELYALMPADQQPSSGWNCVVGFNLKDSAGNQAWPFGVNITEAALTAGGGRDKWVKFSGILSAGAGKTDAAVWISTRGASGAGTPGYTLYIDQFSIVDITEALAAQQTADANAQATSALETRVTTAEGNISSQGSQITSLRNDLTSVQGQVSQKADASALATLSTKVDQQGSTITSQGQSITDLSNNLSLANNDATASHAIPTNMLVNPSFERMLDAWSFSSGGPNGAESVTAQSPASGARMLRTNPVGTVVISQSVKLLAGRTYKYGCFVRAASGTNLQDAGNNKIRLGNFTTGAIIQALAINPADLPTNSTFKEYSGTYTPTADILVTLGLCSSINAGYQYWDDAYIVDITGESKADANAAATTALTTRVSNAEGAITSQGSSITQLRNDLTATNAEVAKKASSTALATLESTVTQQGNTLTSQGDRVTSLENTLTVGDNIVPNSAMLNNAQGWGGHATTVDGYPAVTDTAAWSPTSPKFSVIPGDILDFSLFCVAGVAVTGLAWGIRFDGPNMTNNSIYVGALDYAAGEKKAVTGTITVPVGATTGYLQPYSRNAVALTIYNVNVTRRNAGTIANATAITNLTNKVTQQGTDIASNSSSIESLSNQLVNGKSNKWTRRIYKLQLAGSTTEPTFSDIQGLTPYLIDEVDDTTKLDFGSFGSYTVAHYTAYVRMDADTKITVSPGARVFDDTGAVYVNDARAAAGGSNTSSLAFTLRAGWNKIEFLVNQWTGQAYVNLGLRISDTAKEMYSIMGVSALSSAISQVNSSVSKVGDTVTSNSNALTQLTNSLADTNANVAKKADASALSALQNTVTQQGGTISAHSQSLTQLRNDLTTTQGQVSQKAETTAVSALTQRVTDAEGKLSTQGSSITELTNNIGNMRVGGTNLIPNSGTLAGLSGVVQGELYKGNAIRKVAIAAASGSAYDQFEIELPAPVDGTECVVSFYAKANNVDSLQIFTYLYSPNATLTAVSSQGRTASWATGGDGSMILDLTTNWQRYWIKYTRKPGQTGSQRIIFGRLLKGSKDKEVYISSPKFEYGTMPTEWSEAPADNASASALQALTTRVAQTETGVTSNATAITDLRAEVTAVKGDVAKKADATAVNTLSGKVDQQGQNITSNSSAITELNNNIDRGKKNFWLRQVYSLKFNNAGQIPSLQDLIGVQPLDISEVEDAAQMNFANFGSYLACYYKCMVYVDADTVISFGSGSRIIDDSGQIYINGASVLKLIGSDTSASITLKKGWSVLEIVINQWTGEAYFRPGIKLSDKVGQLYSSAGKLAVASATQGLASRVENNENQITSQGTLVATIKNSVDNLNTAVGGKADSSAVTALTNRVTSAEGKLDAHASNLSQLNSSLTAGDNLVPNPNMLNGGLGWSASSFGTIDGYAAAISTSGWKPSSAKFTVTEGDILDLSLMVQCSGAATINFGIRFDGPSVSNLTVNTDNKVFTANEKARLEKQNIVVPKGCTTALVQAGNFSGVTVSIYNVVVTRRNAANVANTSAISGITTRVSDAEGKLNSTANAVTNLTASLNRRTVFNVVAKGLGSGGTTHGIYDESGTRLFQQSRSYGVVTFKKNADGSTSIDQSQTFDVYSGNYFADYVDSLASGTQVCILTFDEPNQNKDKIYDAVKKLGGTAEAVQSLVYRGAYVLFGYKGLPSGGAIELVAPTGGAVDSRVDASVEFINGVMQGLGGSIGAVRKNEATATALSSLTTRVSNAEGTISSQGQSITKLNNDVSTINGALSSKADASAVSALTGRVTSAEGKLDTQGTALTNLTNNLDSVVGAITSSGRIPNNLIQNSSFEGGKLGYVGWSDYVTVVTTGGNYGRACAKFSAGSAVGIGQSLSVTKGRVYRIGVYAKQDANTTIQDQSNTKFRVANSSGLIGAYGYGPFTQTWTNVQFDWTANVDGVVDIQITAYLNTGAMYFDDFYVIDVTDLKSIQSNSSAITNLNSRVSQIDNDITSQSNSITSLSNSINRLDRTSANLWVDASFESYNDNQQIGGAAAFVTTQQKFTGSKSLCVKRDPGTSGNSDKDIGTEIVLRDMGVYRFECVVLMPQSESPPSNWSVAIGIHVQDANNTNSWAPAIYITESSLPARDQWVRVTGIASLSGGRTRGRLWVSCRGTSGSGTPGYKLYIDDLVITDVTDANAAQATANANTTAISSLNTKVTDIDGRVTANSTSLTQLNSKLDTKADASALNSLSTRVSTAEGKITANANSITSLTTRVGNAESGINGLNETVASMGLAQTTTFQQLRSMIGDNSASITTTNQAFTDLENSTANSVSTLTTQFNGLSASVQQTSNAIADVNGKLSAQWGVKVETNNGVPSVAGIQLGINATGSSAFLVKADTFGVYNPNASGGMNLAFVVKGSQTYIRESFIENGSINNAKIGNFIQSNNYVENQSGWAINKDGGAQFNNAIFRGTIYANDGVFKGTVQADRFIGDIATSASFNGFTVKGGEGSGTMNAWYQNSGYPMTITLNCTVRCNSYAGGVGDQSRDFYVVLTFNINGVQSTRRVVVDMRDKARGLVDIPQSFTVNIPASNSRIGISLTGASYGPQQSEVSVSNIVVTAFRSNNGSFGQ